MHFIRKFRKQLIIIISSIFLLFLLVIIFISPITKYLIEKYDEKYTGRQITIDWAYVNPFTGYIHLSNLKIHELKSDSLFLSANSLSINFSLIKLISKTIEISEFTIDHPHILVVQNKKDFNFSDLVNIFSTTKNSDSTKASIHFTILNLNIFDGEVYYREPLIPINYVIQNINLDSRGKRWDLDTMAVQFSFTSGNKQGNVKGIFSINFKSLDYRFAVAIQNFDLNLIGQYLKDLTNYGHFTASLDADIKSNGNFNDAEDISMNGMMQINNFHFGKNTNEDYAAFDKLKLAINELSPKNHKYLFDSVLLIHPYMKYELYDSLDNFQTVFGRNGSKLTPATSLNAKFNLIIEIGRYVKILAKNFFQSYYQVNHLAINKGDIQFNDYSLSEKFSISLNPLSISADSIDKNHNKVDMFFNSGIKPFGDVNVSLSVNPRDSGTFDMQYKFQKIPISLFNPYTIAYSSFPLDRGTAEIFGTWNVKNGSIESKNHLVIIDPRVTKRLKNESTHWLPLPLIMSFIRDRGNVIDYEIPITGNLKDPKFHLHDVVHDVLENIFVKPATTSYRHEVKEIETEIEKSLSLKWETHNNSLRSTQIRFIEKMAGFLAKNPEASITIQPEQYSLKEKEQILFYEAKKKYFIVTNNIDNISFNKKDSEAVATLSVKDSMFNKYLTKHTEDTMLFTTQEKCANIINEDIINSKFRQLNEERKSAFNYYFKEKNVESQVVFLTAENTIPYDGFTFYKIKYNGKYPESLIRAYKEIMKLNDESPREEFKNERKKASTVQNEMKTIEKK